MWWGLYKVNPGEGLAGCASLSSFFCFLTLTLPHDKVYVHNSEHLLSTRVRIFFSPRIFHLFPCFLFFYFLKNLICWFDLEKILHNIFFVIFLEFYLCLLTAVRERFYDMASITCLNLEVSIYLPLKWSFKKENFMLNKPKEGFQLFKAPWSFL